MDSTRQTKEVTPDEIRKFLLTTYSEPITAMRINIRELPDDFDFLLSGVIDSFGILEMISAIENEFQIQLDLSLLDAEDISRIGPLTRYIARNANERWFTAANWLDSRRGVAVDEVLGMTERLLPGLKNRILQVFARIAPGATTLRVRLNRWRGVKIGKNVWIGYDAIIETSCPELVTIHDGAAIGIRVTIIAHNREQRGVVIEEDATLGAGVIVLPAVTIGRGAMVAAGSVVTKSVPPKTMVQGNPAQPIATIEVPFGLNVSVKEFAKGLKPLRQR
jgi:serine acetyltransferase/acyl carrier protein